MATRSFKQARNYRKGRRGETRWGLNVPPGSIFGVVLHDMESPETVRTAENVRDWFAGPNAPMASAHKNFDSDSIAEGVHSEDEAFHAPPASKWTIGYEQAGVARQTPAEWRDPFSWAMIQIVGAELAADSKKHKFPLEERSVADLKAGRLKGVYTHDTVSKAFGQSDHWDPGPSYPIGSVLEIARKGAHSVAPPEADDELEQGDSGPAVGFLQAMLNILAPYRINSKGKSPGGQLRIDKAHPYFGPKTREAVAEFQRFMVVMWTLSKDPNKGPKPKVNGIADKRFAGAVAFWVPLALKRK